MCGLAWSTASLIVFRVLQGFGGGMILPIGQAILAQAAGPQRMGRVMSVIGVPTLLGPILGPVIGGLIVDNFSWRWIFFVNLPVGVVALALAARIAAARGAPARVASLDVAGCAALAGPGAAGLRPLRVGTQGSLEGTVLRRAGGRRAAARAVRAARPRGAHALIDLSLFRDRAFAAASGTVFIFGVSLFGAMLILPLYYQVVRGESALSAGLLLAPQGVGAAMAMPVAGRLTDQLGAGRIVPFGVVVAVARHRRLHAAVGDDRLRRAGRRAVGARRRAGHDDDAGDGRGVLRRWSGRRCRARTSAMNIIRTIGGSFGTAVLTVVLQRQIVAEVPGATGELRSGRRACRARGRAARPRVRADVLVGGRADRAGADPGIFLPRRPPPAAA